MNQVPKQPTSSEKKTAKALGVRVTKKTRSGSLKPKTQKELQRDIKKAKLGMATVKSLRGGAKKKKSVPTYCKKMLKIVQTNPRRGCKEGSKRTGKMTKCKGIRRCNKERVAKRKPRTSMPKFMQGGAN